MNIYRVDFIQHNVGELDFISDNIDNSISGLAFLYVEASDHDDAKKKAETSLLFDGIKAEDIVIQNISLATPEEVLEYQNYV